MKNIKLLAALDTVKLILVSMASVGIALVIFGTVSTEAIFLGLGTAFVMFMIYTVYQINVSRREYQEITKVDKELLSPYNTLNS